MNAFEVEQTMRELGTLSVGKRSLFALACAERAFCGYHFFYSKTGIGNPERVKELLGHLWGLVSSEEKPILDLQSIFDEVDILTNEVAYSGSWYQAFGEDALLACLHTIQVLQDGDINETLLTAQTALELVYGVIVQFRKIDLNAPDATTLIENDVLFQLELQRQTRDYELLSDERHDFDYFKTLIHDLAQREQSAPLFDFKEFD